MTQITSMPRLRRYTCAMFTSGAHVRSAVENDRLVPAFQPIVDLRTGMVSGFEVLARWKHPKRGPILPANFISLAEEQGLADQLTEKILRSALTVAAAAVPQKMLSVNISPRQLRTRGLAGRLRALCRETGWPVEQLTIEITESALIDNLDMAGRGAAELKSMGCRLALDDFGTGYSSLIHLQALPFDELKVDQSFVREMTRKRESRKIVGAVLELGHSLGLRTVAEGVETEEQCELLYRLGCYSGQGWLYGKPMAATQLGKWRQCSRMGLCPASKSRYFEAQPACGLAASHLAAQLKALYDTAPVGLCLLDRQMRYVTINRLLADMNGVPQHEHLGRTPRETVPDIFSTIEPHIRGALEGMPPTQMEVTRSGIGGGLDRTFSLNYAPVRDEAAEIVGVSVAVVDVTERARAQEALRARGVLPHVSAKDSSAPVARLCGHESAVSGPWMAEPDRHERGAADHLELVAGCRSVRCGQAGRKRREEGESPLLPGRPVN